MALPGSTIRYLLNSNGVRSTVSWCKKLQVLECWKCKKSISLPADVALFSCPCKQKVIIPPTTSNYFKVFGCLQVFDLDLTQLKSKYLELQKILHPDKFSIRSQVEKEYSLQQSALVNKAFSVLSKPYSRGLYLLEVNGLSIDEEENTSIDEIFLEEVMMINEKLAKFPKKDVLIQLKKKIDDYLKESTDMLLTQFNEGNYSDAKETLKRMKYHINIKDKIHYMLPQEYILSS